jgi:predicted hydrocarbon binding protein
MKGVINKGIQEFVEARFGVEVWERIKEQAGCAEPFFVTSEEYPDAMTLALVAAASEVTQLPADAVLEEFGKFWVPNTGRSTYPTFFQLAGPTPREFLKNLNRVHAQVTRNLPGATPPRFEFEDRPGGALRMHYHSERGLCPVLRGLIEGVGIHFDQALGVDETACVRRGDPHCTMEITFP